MGNFQPLADYVKIEKGAQLNIIYVNGLKTEMFRIREKTGSKSYKELYAFPPGSYDITYSVYGKKFYCHSVP